VTQPLYQIRGRSINQNDLTEIRDITAGHWHEGRSAISRILCRQWQWQQPNGQMKDMACRALLLALEKRGEISLPPRQSELFRAPRRADRRHYAVDTAEVTGTIADFGNLPLTMVRRSPDEGLWDALVDRHHYLGRPWIVGSYLKYLAYLDGRLVACLGWGSAAWKVAARDQVIGWNQRTREANLHQVVNNVRFLILPWIKVRHLASKLLAANLRVLAQDWRDFYAHPVVLAETFVDTTRFQGTCYKAANWVHVGTTRGRGKYDRHNDCAETVKAVFLYPLTRAFRDELRG